MPAFGAAPPGRCGPDDLPPLLCRPRYVPKPWGGRRLAETLGRDDLPPGPVGESWEVIDLPEAASLVDGGTHDGARLRDVLGTPFPLLVKVLDAREDLSVQVHPDGARAKEEAWAALADGGAAALGRVAPGALPAPGAWLGALDRHELAGPRPDAPPTLLHVPPGTVHALLAGSLVWEVQTPRDVTWRLDDHGRTGLDGRPRPLHLEEARDVLARGPEAPPAVGDDGRHVAGRRFALHAHPPGTWRSAPGAVAFLLAGGRIALADGGMHDVPPGRTVVLTPRARDLLSEGWMLTATPRAPAPPAGRTGSEA